MIMVATADGIVMKECVDPDLHYGSKSTYSDNERMTNTM